MTKRLSERLSLILKESKPEKAGLEKSHALLFIMVREDRAKPEKCSALKREFLIEQLLSRQQKENSAILKNNSISAQTERFSSQGSLLMVISEH